MAMQTCKQCGKRVKQTRVIISANKQPLVICDACMDKTKAEMLADPQHPAWAIYRKLSEIVSGKRTDD